MNLPKFTTEKNPKPYGLLLYRKETTSKFYTVLK